MKYQYITFGSEEPTLEEIKEKLANDETADFESEYGKHALEFIAQDIVSQNYADWELDIDDNIYVSVFPEGEPEKQELYNVSFSLDISFDTSLERYGLDYDD